MTATDVKEWLLVVSGSITLLSVAISSWLALGQYRLKLKEEERLSVSARTETDIKLVKVFSELMDIAHGRSGHVLSEKTVEFLLAHNFVPDREMSDASAVGRKLAAAAIFALPVGEASQDANLPHLNLGPIAALRDCCSNAAMMGSCSRRNGLACSLMPYRTYLSGLSWPQFRSDDLDPVRIRT